MGAPSYLVCMCQLIKKEKGFLSVSLPTLLLVSPPYIVVAYLLHMGKRKKASISQ